mgnify:CR=1 FL=1
MGVNIVIMNSLISVLNMELRCRSVPETPQHNGVAERMNITLDERAKKMRLHASLPKMF